MDKILIKNFLTEKQRKTLLKEVKLFLVDCNKEFPEQAKKGRFPGLQTGPLMQQESSFEWYHTHLLDTLYQKMNIHFTIDKSWANWTNGKKRDIAWHDHAYVPYVCVYYIKTFPLFSNGTLFEDGLFKSPQNSLLIFAGKDRHTTPHSPLRFGRYTMSSNLMKGLLSCYLKFDKGR